MSNSESRGSMTSSGGSPFAGIEKRIVGFQVQAGLRRIAKNVGGPNDAARVITA